MATYQNPGHTTLSKAPLGTTNGAREGRWYQASEWAQLLTKQRCASRNTLILPTGPQSDRILQLAAKCMHALCTFLGIAY